MRHQIERAAIAKSYSCEMTNVARRQPVDTERFRERHDRTVHEAEFKIGKRAVDVHRSEELTEVGRRVGEGPASEILDEDLHRPALVP